ncbi:unnamed protein product [Brassicogethes aeneus]|uniref:Uncharacterized protein n=1 Tax=Brassicogethes aeneus TaxID=1431903 RepID=A0A9P0B2L1_BRAAE|nr:unnamed protein product [Brassicogethes aeneus]
MIICAQKSLFCMFKMCDKIDAKEVLMYLNELGYQNINAIQLKDFLKDLKKIIKYEKIQKSTNQDHTTYQENFSNGTDNSNAFYKLSSCNAQYDQPTFASKARQVQPRDKKITVQISKPTINHKHCKHVNDSFPEERKNPLPIKLVSSTEESVKTVPFNSETSIKPLDGKNVIRSKECK